MGKLSTTENYTEIALHKLKELFSDWRCRIASSTDAISQMDLFMTIVHGCQMLLMTYVTVSFI